VRKDSKTKLSDKGYTKVLSGKTVRKDSLGIEICGDIDELVAILGIARFYSKKQMVKKEIINLQNCLFLVGSEISAQSKTKNSYKITQAHVEEIDDKLYLLNKKVSFPKKFVVHGNDLQAAYINYSRSISRRLERKIVNLFFKKRISNKNLLVWLNRLSSYLFLLSRYEELKKS